MRFILEKKGLGNARLNMVKQVCVTCRASASLPCKCNEECACDFVLYRSHVVFHIVDRQGRERRVREVIIEAIAQAIAVAKRNRALTARTAPDGARL